MSLCSGRLRTCKSHFSDDDFLNSRVSCTALLTLVKQRKHQSYLNEFFTNSQFMQMKMLENVCFLFVLGCMQCCLCQFQSRKLLFLTIFFHQVLRRNTSIFITIHSNSNSNKVNKKRKSQTKTSACSMFYFLLFFGGGDHA